MQENKKHIALITTWFPPRNGVAVNRMLAFVKYLNHSKFHISVVTLKENNEPDMEIIEGANIFRIKNKSFLSTFQEKAGEPKFIHNLKVLWNVILNFLNPFEYSDWKNSIVRCLKKINSENKFDLVISSSSPVEAHLAANEFCEKNHHIGWIADIRDEMSKNPYITNKLKKYHVYTEKEINERANAITTVSEPILNDFKKLMPDVKYFEEIRNGFDHNISPQKNFNEVFTIAYAGTFYGAIKPQTFFRGLQQFVQKETVKINLQFIGTNRNFDIPVEFKNTSEFIPKLSNLDAIKLIAKADANLLVLPSGNRKGVFTGKIFDYLSVMKPIIAVVDTTDVAANLIAEYHAGFVADFNDINQIENAIASAYQFWKEKKALPFDAQKVQLLHRKYQIEKLERLIDKLLSQ